MGTLILGCASALVVATAALASSCLRLRSTIGFLLAVHVLATAEIVALSLGLSTVRAITRPVVLAVVVVAFALVLAVWLLSEHPRPRLAPLGHALRDALDDMAVAALAALAVAVHLYLLVVSLALPQSLPDTLLYHLPRAALWKQQHAVAYVVDSGQPDQRLPAGRRDRSDGLDGPERTATGTVGLVQLLALAAACACDRRHRAAPGGLSRSAALFGALAFATFTVVALQAPTALNDLVVASLLVVCAYFAIGVVTRAGGLALCAAALALSGRQRRGRSSSPCPSSPSFVLASQPRSRWWPLAAAGAVGARRQIVWFVLNLAETGESTWGRRVRSGPRTPCSSASGCRSSTCSSCRTRMRPAILVSPRWGLAVLAAACIVGVVLAVRGRPRAGGVALLIGVLAFFATPLLVTWVRVADRVLAHARSAVGLGSREPTTRLPAGFIESPMHSSYGLAFVVLFIGAGVLVVDDVRRRRLPVAALVALAGVPVAVLLSALALAYDPQRMRYVAFAVALAATVLGTALRVRPLAWTSIALATVTLAVAVAYFVPRPAGLALLSENRTPERSARWFVQAESGNGDIEAFRFLAERIPADATIALDVASNTYLYPAWMEGCRRTVLFVPDGGPVPEDAEWLVVGPGRPATRSPRSGGVGARALVSSRLAHLQPRVKQAHRALVGVRVPTRPAAPRTRKAGATGTANSMIV